MSSHDMIGPDGHHRQGVEAYTAPELHRFLVADAVRSHATNLTWAIEAYKRIGAKTGRGAEAAFQAVLDEVESLTGHRRMPISAATQTEIAAQLGRPQ